MTFCLKRFSIDNGFQRAKMTFTICNMAPVSEFREIQCFCELFVFVILKFLSFEFTACSKLTAGSDNHHKAS